MNIWVSQMVTQHLIFLVSTCQMLRRNEKHKLPSGIQYEHELGGCGVMLLHSYAMNTAGRIGNEGTGFILVIVA